MSPTSDPSRARTLTDIAFSRRSLLQAGLLAGVIPLLAACAPGGRTTTSSSELSFWSRDSLGDGAMQVPVRERVAAFDALNKTTSQVQFLNLADSSQKELAGLTGGGLPTLAEQGPDVTMQFAAGKHLLELDDLYAKLQPSFAALPKAAVTEVDGHIYGMPWWLETRVLYYHTDLLEAAGVKPPTTWSEWLDVAAATSKGSDQYGFVIAGTGANPGQFLAPLAASAGATLIDASGALTSDSSGFADTFDFLQKLFAYMPPATPTYDATTSQQLFLAKKAAMTWDNGSLLAVINSTHPELADTVAAVATPAADSSATSRSFLGGFELFAFAKGESSDKATALMEFMYADPDWYATFLKTGGGISLPVLASSSSNEAFTSGIGQTMIEQLPTAVRYAGPEFGTTPYMGKAETTSVFANPVVDVWTGKNAPTAAASSMLDALKQLSTGS